MIEPRIDPFDKRRKHTRSKKRVEHYDGITKPAHVSLFICGHGAEYTYEDPRPCDVCRDRATRINNAVRTCQEHNSFINNRRTKS